MEICTRCPSLDEEDLRAALAELKTYVDITQEDLLKIYVLAVRHARARRSTAVTVGTVMRSEVVLVTAGRPVVEAARLLSEHKISGMPVVDAHNRVIGVISLADLPRRAAEGSRESWTDRIRRVFGGAKYREEAVVGEVMSAPPVTTEPEADVKEVAAVLDLHRIKRLPVVDREGKLVGIISRGDIIRLMGTKH